VIIPHLRDDTGIAPARRKISNCTGVHCLAHTKMFITFIFYIIIFEKKN
jgi:hypothetical protein